ncbi:MAG: NAD(P)/FAD-dependent oxidoreductase [Burkholderiaceae bacterium]|nr:MAG: NAD(P)/FAD-dependent oxidoreductase [Burkholderiaceae bacterium]
MASRPGDAAPAGEPIATDAVVIGAGPVGLFQVFELGLQDIRAHVVDAHAQVGGQPALLYPDKPIYDIPGLPVCTGQGLTDALLRQARPFEPQFHLGQTVTGLQRQVDGRLLLTTSAGVRLLSKTVFVAAGVGAFEPRRLKLEGLDRFEGTQLHHHLEDPLQMKGQAVVVIGDGDEAIDATLSMSGEGPVRARSVTLVHRRDSFKAHPDSVARMRERCREGSMHFVAGQPVAVQTEGERLIGLELVLPDGDRRSLPLDQLLVLQGLSPRLGPVTEWGLDMERKLLRVDTQRYATNEPGIFAVGDINTYPGKRKLLVCGFHECTLAAFAAVEIVHPERPVLLQYTTSSSHLHKILGVYAA